MVEKTKPTDPLEQLTLISEEEETGGEPDDVVADIDSSRVSIPSETEKNDESVIEIEQTAIKQNEEFEKIVSEFESGQTEPTPNEIKDLVKTYSIKEVFRDEAKEIQLPQFYLSAPANDLFGIRENEVVLEKENLLEGFALSKSDTNIAFDNVAADLYKVDLDETKKEHTPTFVRLDGTVKERILTYLLDPARKSSRVRNFTARIMSITGSMYPIPDKEIEKYITHILEDFTDDQFADFANNEYTYIDKIKKKIKALSEEYAEKKFKDFLDTDKVFIKATYSLPAVISPGDTAKDITKSLYEQEGKMNTFEERVINEIGNMPNVAFWTRNLERKGYRINGFINHYPDFIIQTKSRKTVVLETKGDHLDAEQKIRLGSMWAAKAGNDYRYFMVYERRAVDGAYKLDEFLEIMRKI